MGPISWLACSTVQTPIRSETRQTNFMPQGSSFARFRPLVRQISTPLAPIMVVSTKSGPIHMAWVEAASMYPCDGAKPNYTADFRYHRPVVICASMRRTIRARVAREVELGVSHEGK